MKVVVAVASFLLGIAVYSAQAQTRMITITGERVNVRSGPGRTYDILGMVNTNEKFEIFQEQDGWYQISVDGTVGWIPAKATSVSVADIQQILAQADTYFSRQQFTTPPDENAYDLYRQVLQQYPENDHALKRIAQIARTYKTWADAAYQQGDTRKAQVFYQRYLFVSPGDDEAKQRLQQLEQHPAPATEPLRMLRLRHDPETLSSQHIIHTVKRLQFHHPADWSKYELSASLTGTMRHDYAVTTTGGISLILDQATGLLWQQQVPQQPMTWEEAHQYIARLNTSGYASFSDWRLPTIEELASLLEPEKTASGLYLAKEFGATPLWCWSSDRSDAANAAWYVSFNSGGIQQHTLENAVFVLAVRTSK